MGRQSTPVLAQVIFPQWVTHFRVKFFWKIESSPIEKNAPVPGVFQTQSGHGFLRFFILKALPVSVFTISFF